MLVDMLLLLPLPHKWIDVIDRDRDHSCLSTCVVAGFSATYTDGHKDDPLGNRLLDRATDAAINITGSALLHPDGQHVRFVNVLKVAVERDDRLMLRAILSRFPGVEVDVVHLNHPLAEPLVLSITYMCTNEQIVQELEEKQADYHSRLPRTIRDTLIAWLPVPDLSAIVESYAKRMPLSDQLVFLPKSFPHHSTTIKDKCPRSNHRI